LEKKLLIVIVLLLLCLNCRIYAQVTGRGERFISNQSDYYANPRKDSLTNPVNPLQRDTLSITVGFGDQYLRLPVVMNYLSSLFETVYTATELDSLQGTISGLKFYNNFTQSLLQKPTVIWLGTTTQNDLAEGWIASTQLFQVFSGLVDYPSGQNVISITLDNPFTYVGNENLVMMVQRPRDEEYYSSSNKFRAQSDGTNRSRIAQSDYYIYNPAWPPDTGYLNDQYPLTTFVYTPLEFGQIQGTVLDNMANPLSGAQISILNSELSTVSNAIGQFSFNHLSPGDYQLVFSKYGYFGDELSVNVSESEPEQVQINLFPMPKVSVLGLVLNSEGACIANAEITLNGYADYQVLSPVESLFVIDGVYANQSYSYQISAQGYTTQNGIVQVGGENLLWTSTLTEEAFPPVNVQAHTTDTVAVITWDLVDLVNDLRAIQGYKVWRLREEQLYQPESWELLTLQHINVQWIRDAAWQALEPGCYLWAVQALYSDGIASDCAFSNSILKSLEYGALVGFVYGSNLQPLAGAEINANNQVVFTNTSGAYYLVLPQGAYTVTAFAHDYDPQTCNDVQIGANQNTQLDFTLNPVANTDEYIQINETTLLGSYPNPFSGSTNISYSLKTPDVVSLQIYNIKGRLVRCYRRMEKSSGINSIDFDGLDMQGKPLPSGVYLYRFSAGEYRQTGKILRK